MTSFWFQVGKITTAFVKMNYVKLSFIGFYIRVDIRTFFAEILYIILFISESKIIQSRRYRSYELPDMKCKILLDIRTFKVVRLTAMNTLHLLLSDCYEYFS